MTEPPRSPTRPSVLVTDFDGTLTRREFYQLVRDSLVPPETPDYWVEYRAGRISHFEALRRFFAAAEGGEEALIALTAHMQLEPELPARLTDLQAAGWDVVVVSAGCIWYIQRLLDEAGVNLPVHTNQGRIEDGRLIMEPPVESPFFCPNIGVNKAAVVQSFLDEGRQVAFAGDGYPDLEAALLVADSLRFARRDLAKALTELGKTFRPFERWAEVARGVLAQSP